MPSSSSEDEFVVSPRPRKRRRVKDGNDSRLGDFIVPDVPSPSKAKASRAKRVSSGDGSPSKPRKATNPKRRSCVVDAPVHEDVKRFAATANADDLPPASQPWSTRGAIWTIAPPPMLPLKAHKASSCAEIETAKSDHPSQHMPPPASGSVSHAPKPKSGCPELQHSQCKSGTVQDAGAQARATGSEPASNAAHDVLHKATTLADSARPGQDINRAVACTQNKISKIDLHPTSVPTLTDSHGSESDYGSDDLDFELAINDVSLTNPPAMSEQNHPARRKSHPLCPSPIHITTSDPSSPDHERPFTTVAESQPAASDLLADLPSDAFSDSEFQPLPQVNKSFPAIQKPRMPQNGLHQMTLFGSKASNNMQAPLREREDTPPRAEPPTHHKLESEATMKWIYPMNLGDVRDYQYNIVKRGLFHNLLVALPTGLGKTFIAATIMLNWYRWTVDAQIVFVAPTKPLVSQQVDACLNVAGIPRSQSTMLTGGISPGLRAEEWKNKRLFFMTPQTLINDLKSGIADPKRLVLLVVDEAHRATGSYAYVEVVRYLRRFTKSFRVLALTATPGNSVNAVQNVIDGLDISRIEIRTEFSLDIRRYIHSKDIDRKIFQNSEEILMVMDFFSKAVQPVLSKLCQFNAFWNKDPLGMTAYGLVQARQKWVTSDAGRNANPSVKGMVQKIFQVLASLAHGIDLLKYHGIKPFYNNMQRFRDAQLTARNGGKYEREILDSAPFQTMMTRLQHWVGKPDFVGHPKLDFLQASILEHFAGLDDGANSTTRVMIFAHFRDSAEEIVRVLSRNSPMIRPHVFVGQAASKDSEGMDQKKQLEIINDFKSGKYNTLVATSIGEEGLDIGEIDLIICYDSSSSPIRMLQRMGRTGRKRAGKILLLLMSGKEENSYVQAQDNYRKMQHTIAEGTEFQFHGDLSTRILPPEIQPELDKRVVEIPVENVDAALPEPTKGTRRAPKRPPKRFNMPDGVVTGFVTAGNMRGASSNARAARSTVELEVPPSVEDVCLTVQEEREFHRRYVNVAAGSADLVVDLPDVSGQPASQQRLGLTSLVPHGSQTKSTVTTLKLMRGFNMRTIDRWDTIHSSFDIPLLCGPDRSIDAAPTQLKPPPEVAGKPAARKAAPISTSKAPRSNPPGRKRKQPTKSAARFMDCVEGHSSSPAPTDPRMHLASQGISLGSGDTSGEDDNEADGGSDLDGWLVPSDAESADLGNASSSSTTSSRTSRRVVEPSDSSDDSVPELQTILRNGTQHVGKKKSAGKRRKRIVEDSDDE